MNKALTYEEAFIRDMAVALNAKRLRRAAVSGIRSFNNAMGGRLTSGWATSITSGDSELRSGLRTLRQRSRALIQDSAFAKRAKTLVVNNVIGSGVGMQAQVKTTRDELNERVNSDIEAAWTRWCKASSCHTGGTLHFNDLERFAMGQVFEAGECIIRKHYRKFGNSRIPIALEVIEGERLVEDQYTQVLLGILPGNTVRMGVEIDAFHRPVAYFLRHLHPGDTSQVPAGERDYIERVPAEDIIHLRIVERWPQTRGVPWMHTVLRKLNDLDGYTEAEIVRARGQANTVGALKTSRPYGDAVKDENNNITERQISGQAGTWETLYEDEELQYPPPSSPNSSAEPFLRFWLREIAAGTGPSYGALSRDRSQGTYSSERQDLIDDRDTWRVFQSWWINTFRSPFHGVWLNMAVLAREIVSVNPDSFYADMEKFTAVRFKPRGWSWIDPTKEVAAYKESIMGGLGTLTDTIAKTADGRDVEDILEERARELKLKKNIEARYGVKLDLDTDPGAEKKQIQAASGKNQGKQEQNPGNQDQGKEQGGQNNADD